MNTVKAKKSVLVLVLSICVHLCSSVVHSAEPANSLFEQLRTDGLSVTAETKVPLLAPLMADGLDAAGQRDVLEKVVGRRFTVREFTAKVGTAPHVYAIRKIAAVGEDAPRVLGVDVSFVAHGNLDTVADRY